MTTIKTSFPPDAPPFHIYEDPEDREVNVAPDTHDADGSFISDMSLQDADEPMPSIERVHEHEDMSEDEPRPYNAKYTSRRSDVSSRSIRHASGMTSTSLISSLPSEISVYSKPIPVEPTVVDSRYAPRKDRPPFRNPSSVRAMQMASPPPFATFDSGPERLKGQYKLDSYSRSARSETPVSRRPTSHRGSRQGSHFDPQVHAPPSPRPTPAPQQQYPLVLLHVTILPPTMPYEVEMMKKIAPEWLMENYKMLEEKLKDIVLVQRGLLIPHPKDEYELLEERLLESLELKTPRLLKCGHFVGPGGGDDEDEDEDGDGDSVADAGGRDSRMSGGTITVEDEGWKLSACGEDGDRCHECQREVKKPGQGVGSGNKRWDIKIFAANGLMRSGAWAAAWREMERVDVEITPWIPDDVRKALKKRKDEEEEQLKNAKEKRATQQADLQRRLKEEARQKYEAEVLRLKREEFEAAERKRLADIEAKEKKRLEDFKAAEERRLAQMLEERIEEAKEALRIEVQVHAQVEGEAAERKLRQLEEELKKHKERLELETRAPPAPISAPPIHGNQATRSESRGRYRSLSPRKANAAPEIPLSTLLKNYIILLIQDRRNIAIALLSAMVALLALRTNPPAPGELPTPSRSRILSEPHLATPDSPFVVTMTSIETATQTAVLTTTATMTATTTATTTVTQAQQQPDSSTIEQVSMQTASLSSTQSASSKLLSAPTLLSTLSLFSKPPSSTTAQAASPSAASSRASQSSQLVSIRGSPRLPTAQDAKSSDPFLMPPISFPSCSPAYPLSGPAGSADNSAASHAGA